MWSVSMFIDNLENIMMNSYSYQKFGVTFEKLIRNDEIRHDYM